MAAAALKHQRIDRDGLLSQIGVPVTLVLKTEDVTHGFMSRPLKIDTDIPPGKETRVMVTPQTEGKFTVICNHFCGMGHGNMRMTIIVE